MRRTRAPASGVKRKLFSESPTFTMARTPPTLHLKPGKEKSLLRRHPWIYANAIDRASGGPASGDTVRVLGADGRFLAWAAFSPTSALRARAWSFTEAEHPDAAFIAARVAAAVARREGLQAQTEAIRLVFGEADALPGLVVDRYRDQLVVQFLAAGVEHWRDVIVAALREVTGCEAVYERSDAAAREREGLVAREGVLHGDLPATLAVSEHGVRYEVDVITGHKTGFYIDQRDSRRLVGEYAQGRRVLNCFCYTGGFTLAARLGGAVEAVSVDSSAEALAVAARNEQLNGLAPSTWLQANVFDALKNLLAEGRQFDLIVLDPPKFAPSVQHLDRAARAYKEINLKALRLLAPGGLLFTFSCSGAVSVDLFQKIVAGAVFDARTDMQMLRRLAAGVDHPMSMTHPEGEYLKGLMLRRM
jgi:23S rRNA (cytosine1962-C5)-methyltransferase